MNYFINDKKEIFAYDDKQVLQGYGASMTSISEDELMVILKEREEAIKNTIKYKVSEARTYLASTDYIVTKIAEAQALGEDTTTLLTKYAVEIQQRKEARAFIDANL